MKSSNQRYNYQKLTYKEVENGLGQNSMWQEPHKRSAFSKFFRVHETWRFNGVLHTNDYQVEVWQSRYQARCNCPTFESDFSLCPHLALVLIERWQELMPTASTPVPTAPPVDPLDRIKTEFNRMVVADLVELRKRYNDPVIRKWYW